MCTGPRDDRLEPEDVFAVEAALIRQARGETVTAREARSIARVHDDGFIWTPGEGFRRNDEIRNADEIAAYVADAVARFGSIASPEVERPAAAVTGAIRAALWDAAIEPPVSLSAREAYAAAGRLRDAGEARDDDLAWPEAGEDGEPGWTWGPPAPACGTAAQTAGLPLGPARDIAAYADARWQVSGPVPYRFDDGTVYEPPGASSIEFEAPGLAVDLLAAEIRSTASPEVVADAAEVTRRIDEITATRLGLWDAAFEPGPATDHLATEAGRRAYREAGPTGGGG